jgi:hypothetical protein
MEATLADKKEPWERWTCSQCHNTARWALMKEGQPTNDRRCQKHGPKALETYKRDKGGRIWKRC